MSNIYKICGSNHAHSKNHLPIANTIVYYHLILCVVQCSKKCEHNICFTAHRVGSGEVLISSDCSQALTVPKSAISR